MTGLGEGVDLLGDTLLHDGTNLCVNLVPDGQIAELGLVDAVQCLSNAVDGVAAGLCCNFPLLPLELHELVLSFDTLAHEVEIHGNAGLLFNELPALLDILLNKLVCKRIVKLHGHLQSIQGLIIEPVLKDSGCNGTVASFVTGDHERAVIGNIVEDEEAGLSLTHRAGVTGQTDGLNCVDVVMYGVAVNMAGYEVRDHLKRNCLELVAPAVEHTAPSGFLHCHGVVPGVVLLAAVQSGVGVEHAHELVNGCIDHCTIVPCGCSQSFAAQTFKATVEPVENGQIGLTYPAISPNALDEVDNAAILHDVHYHVQVIVQPNVVEVVEGILYATPLSVLVKTGLGQVVIAQATAAFFCGMRLAIPEIFNETHITCPPESS